MKMEVKIELGSKVRDLITGFEGIVIAYSHHLTGCDTIGVKPQTVKDSKTVECSWFDVTQVQVLEEPTPEFRKVASGKMVESKKSDVRTPGGPQEHPNI